MPGQQLPHVPSWDGDAGAGRATCTCFGFSVPPNASGAGQGVGAMHGWAAPCAHHDRSGQRGHRDRGGSGHPGCTGPLCLCPLWAQPPLSPAWVAPLQWHLGAGSTWPGVGSGCPAGVGTLPPSALAPRSCTSPGSGSGPEQTGEICKQAPTGPQRLPSPCAAAGPSRGMGMLGVEPGQAWRGHSAAHPAWGVTPCVGTDPAPTPCQLGRKRTEPGQRLAWVIRLCAGRPGRMGLCHTKVTGPPPSHAGCSSATRATDGVLSLQTPLPSAWQTGAHHTG